MEAVNQDWVCISEMDGGRLCWDLADMRHRNPMYHTPLVRVLQVNHPMHGLRRSGHYFYFTNNRWVKTDKVGLDHWLQFNQLPKFR